MDRRRFNYKKRKQLEEYLLKKVTITRIAEVFGISRGTIYNEIHKGIIKNSSFESYSAELAQKKEELEMIEKLRGE